MSKRAWIFISNTFEVNTRSSKRKMLTLSTDTDSKLNNESANPDILVIFNEYHPVHIAYRDMFENYEVVSGERKGKTLNLKTLMSEGLPLELRKWEAAVRTVYPEDTPEETEIFPRKRIPFQSGTYETRISAVGTLKQKLQSDPAFTTLATQVASYHNLLLTARDTQQQKEGSLGQLSDLLEAQRVINADALYGIVLGQLMKKFRTDRTQIERFFDMSLLRSTGEEEEVLRTLTGTVAPGLINNEGALQAGENKLRMTVVSGGPLEFGLSVDGLNSNGNTTTMSAPGSTTYLISDFASAGNLMVIRNQNLTTPGEYKIETLA